MKDLPGSARFYILLVFALGLGAVFASLRAFTFAPLALLVILVLAILIAALDQVPVRLYAKESDNGVEVTISVAVRMAAILLFPPPYVILAVFVGTWLAEALAKRSWYKFIFNVGMMTINCTIVAVAYTVLRQPDVALLGSPQNLLALVALGVGDFAVNTLLVSMVIALATKFPISYVWRRNFHPNILHDLSMLPIAVFIYILWQYNPWSVVLAALPLFVMRHSYQIVYDLGRQSREALYALARVLDERDEQTSQHSELVAEHAGVIALTMGLGPEQVEVIKLAAAMHDIGKLGMRNDILFKPGMLTPQERELAKRHAVIGADLLKKFPLFDKGTVYVRHHHERWDGSGYPDGLSGDAIPLGARILAVADSYQAMTEQRPYRDPLPEEYALEQLREGAGSQFDPKVVAAFLKARGADDALPQDKTPYLSHKAISAPKST